MKTTVLMGTLAAAGLAVGVAGAATLEDVKAKGICSAASQPVSPGFRSTDSERRMARL